MKSLTFEPRPMDELKQSTALTHFRTGSGRATSPAATSRLLTSLWKAGKTTLNGRPPPSRSLGTGELSGPRDLRGCQGPCGLRGVSRTLVGSPTGISIGRTSSSVSRPFLERPSPRPTGWSSQLTWAPMTRVRTWMSCWSTRLPHSSPVDPTATRPP